MKELKLTEILASFTAEEIKRFKKFVESPYHNGSVNVISLIREVIKFYPEFSSKNYNLKYIHGKIFKDKIYHEGVMRNLVSDLYKLSESFLVVDGLLKNKTEYELALMKRFKENQLDDLFHLNYKKIRADLDNIKKDDNYFFNLYLLENDLWSLFIVDKKAGKKHEEFIYGTVENTKQLVKFFLARILKSYCSIVSNAVNFKVKPELNFYNEIKNHIEKNNYEDTPVISLYFNSLKLALGEEKENTFKKLHSVIKENKEILHHDDLHVIYINLLNNSISKKDYRTCFGLIKEIYAGQYFSRIGKEMYMEYGFYSAAIHTAIFLKEFDWVDNFVKTSKSKINPPHRDNSFHYHLALIEFKRKNFDIALEILSKLNPNDFFFLVYTQRLRLAVYYELGNTEEIFYLMDTYKHTLSRHSRIEERYIKYGKEFIVNFSELIKLKEKFDGFRCKTLKEKILLQESVSVFKDWFLEKLDELKK